MGWKVEFDSAAQKQLRRIDRTMQQRIVAYLEATVDLPDPRLRGKPLRSRLSGLWSYRVGDCRAVCQVHDDVLIVRVIKVGHRSAVYDE